MVRKIVAFILVLLITLLASVPGETALAASDDAPEVTVVRGAAFVYKNGGYQATAIYRGMEIDRGDLIETGPNASVTISFYQKELVVGECSRVSLNDIWNRHERDFTSIVLVEGMIKNRVDLDLDQNSKNEIRTSNMVAGVRGTEYILIYSRMGLDDGGVESNYTRLVVVEGSVRIDTPDDNYLMDEGGTKRIEEDIRGNQTLTDINQGMEGTLEDVDVSILEALMSDSRAQNYHDEIRTILEKKATDPGANRTPEKPQNGMIKGSEADRILPNLPPPGSEGTEVLPLPPSLPESGSDQAAFPKVPATIGGEEGNLPKISVTIGGEEGNPPKVPVIAGPTLPGRAGNGPLLVFDPAPNAPEGSGNNNSSSGGGTSSKPAAPLKTESISFAEDVNNIRYGKSGVIYPLTETGTGKGEITYSSNDPSVASVDSKTGEITSKKAGTAVITAQKASDGEYAGTTASYVLTVDKKTLIPLINAESVSGKVYDGTTDIAGMPAIQLIGAVNGETPIASATFAFADKTAGDDKKISASGITLASLWDEKYKLSTVTLTGDSNVSISKKSIAAIAAADISCPGKIYDGTKLVPSTWAITITPTAASGIIAGDVVGATYAAASFADENAAGSVALNVTGILLTGSDGDNYSLMQTSASATGTIEPKPLTVTVTNPTTALTPIDTTDFTVSVSGFVSDSDATGATVTWQTTGAGSSSGITLSDSQEASGTVKTVTVTAKYDGLIGTSHTVGITLDSDFDSNYTYQEGEKEVAISCLDGTTEDRAIPVTQANILRADTGFHAYASTAEGLARHYILTENIILTGQANWTPIGTLAEPFTGGFDGGNVTGESDRTISGLHIDISGPGRACAGFFGYMSGAEVKNLAITNGYVATGSSDGSTTPGGTGGIAGEIYNRSLIQNCHFLGIVTSSQGKVGGIVGISDLSSVENCIVGCGVLGTGEDSGGIAGYAIKSTITDSKSEGVVTVMRGDIGGIVGESRETMISGCFSGSDLTAIKGSAGGIVGDINGGVDGCAITDCQSYGSVKSNDGNAGGIVGTSSGITGVTISECITGENVTAPNGVGGIIGNVTIEINITDCYVLGNVTATDGTASSVAGGITANHFKGSITRCYVTGNVTASSRVAGGITGFLEDGLISDCYVTGDVTGTYSVGGIVGEIEKGKISHCYASGAVSGTDYIGGIVGNSSGGEVSFNVALNSKIAASGPLGYQNLNRIGEATAPVVSNNYAREDMEYENIDGMTPDVSDCVHDTSHGETITSDEWEDMSWWSGKGFTDSWWDGKLPPSGLSARRSFRSAADMEDIDDTVAAAGILTVTASEGGQISLDGEVWETEITREYAADETAAVTVTASSDEGYRFTGWLDADDNLVSEENEYIITVTGNMTLRAVFEMLSPEEDETDDPENDVLPIEEPDGDEIAAGEETVEEVVEEPEDGETDNDEEAVGDQEDGSSTEVEAANEQDGGGSTTGEEAAKEHDGGSTTVEEAAENQGSNGSTTVVETTNDQGSEGNITVNETTEGQDSSGSITVEAATVEVGTVIFFNHTGENI